MIKKLEEKLTEVEQQRQVMERMGGWTLTPLIGFWA